MGTVSSKDETAIVLAKAIPDVQHRTLEAHTHAPSPEVPAPVLAEFFAA